MSEHGHLQELVAKSLDAGLDNSERSTLGQHLPVCSECRHLQDELRRNDELIGVSDRDILVRPLTTARRTERVSNLSQLFVAVGVAAVFAVALLVGDSCAAGGRRSVLPIRRRVAHPQRRHAIHRHPHATCHLRLSPPRSSSMTAEGSGLDMKRQARHRPRPNMPSLATNHPHPIGLVKEPLLG